MAIFNVNESSLGEYLNEHGGLRNRLLKNRVDAFKNYTNIRNNYDKIENSAISKEQKEKIKKLRKHDEKEALKKARDTEEEFFKLADNRHQPGYEGIRKATKDYLKQKEKEHISRGINSGKKTVDLSKKQSGQYKDLADSRKRLRLKEAAEYIISVLDEID